jgi:2-keto-4-pentenoate hydratase/2-oxohepta-3-ene-1,7-dioic acid hydratase in catechol pathway
MKEMLAGGLGPAKGKDTCSVMGPCLVTPDEVDPGNLRMTARVNGELWSENSSGTAYWTWPQIIEFASMEETLHPGDFLGSGTVEHGCGMELNRWIQPGDVIELEVSAYSETVLGRSRRSACSRVDSSVHSMFAWRQISG